MTNHGSSLLRDCVLVYIRGSPFWNFHDLAAILRERVLGLGSSLGGYELLYRYYWGTPTDLGQIRWASVGSIHLVDYYIGTTGGPTWNVLEGPASVLFTLCCCYIVTTGGPF